LKEIIRKPSFMNGREKKPREGGGNPRNHNSEGILPNKGMPRGIGGTGNKEIVRWDQRRSSLRGKGKHKKCKLVVMKGFIRMLKSGQYPKL